MTVLSKLALATASFAGGVNAGWQTDSAKSYRMYDAPVPSYYEVQTLNGVTAPKIGRTASTQVAFWIYLL